MVDSIVLSLIDDESGPLVRAEVITPLLYLSSSDLYYKAELTVWDLSLLNLLPSTPFPTLLAPLRPPAPRSSRVSRRAPQGEHENFLHITAIKVRGASDIGADYFKYVGVAVQPFDINIEGAILTKLTAFKDRVMKGLTTTASASTSSELASATAALAALFPAPSASVFEPPAATENKCMPSNTSFREFALISVCVCVAATRALCLGQMDLHPIACRLSFKYVSGFDYSSLHSILSWTGGFANIDAAPLRFQ